MFGSVRDDAASRRANIRLVEARNSRLVWAQLLDFSSAESGAENPAVQIAHQLLLAESRRPMPANPGAGHHVLLGRARLDGEQDAKANKDAQELFEKAYALDGNSIQALLGLAQPLVSDVLNGWVTPDQRPAALERAEAALRHVIAPDPRNVRGHFCSWRACAGAPDSDQAVAAYEHTLDLNRNFPHAHAALGRALIEVGREKDSIPYIEQALRLAQPIPRLGPVLLGGNGCRPRGGLRSGDSLASQVPRNQSCI